MIKFEELSNIQKTAVAMFIKEGAGKYDFGRSISGSEDGPIGQIGSGFSDLATGGWRNIKAFGNQVGSGFTDLKSGLSKDLGDIGENWDKNWDRRRKESQYGNFANIGPLLPLGLGATWLGGSMIGKLLRRGK